jgi:ribosome-associated translation inhibitor RaiA
MIRIIQILTLITFTSCDPGVVNKYVIENRTESDLEIESILKYVNRNITENDSAKTVELKPKTESIIMEYGEIGNAHDKGFDFFNAIDTLIVKMDDRILKKNVFDRKNWEYRVLKSGLFSMDEVEYKLVLTDNNFE